MRRLIDGGVQWHVTQQWRRQQAGHIGVVSVGQGVAAAIHLIRVHQDAVLGADDAVLLDAVPAQAGVP
jgi:hypothetical protein